MTQPTDATGEQANRISRHRGRSWAQEVEIEAEALRTRVRVLRARQRWPQGISAEEAEARLVGVEGLLRQADCAARGHSPRHYVFVSWWRGTSIDAAFQNVHKAEAELVPLFDDNEVVAEIPAAVARVDVALSRDDPMRVAAQHLSGSKDDPALRTMLSKVIEVGHDAADRQHSRIRSFRNVVIVTGLLIAVLDAVFGVVAYYSPSSVPLCFTPPDLPLACPAGDAPGQQPGRFDMLIVALLGTLGGSLAAAVSIRNLRGTSTPYDIPVCLALLKVPAGALTAVGALIAIRGQFVPGLSALDSQEQILAYALVFGYSQQLLTGLIDQRAHGLLDGVAGRDSEQRRPPPPAGRVRPTGTEHASPDQAQI